MKTMQKIANFKREKNYSIKYMGWVSTWDKISVFPHFLMLGFHEVPKKAAKYHSGHYLLEFSLAFSRNWV